MDETKALQQVARWDVIRVYRRSDSMQGEGAKGPVDRQGCGLAGKAAAPMVRSQGVADFGAAVARFEPEQGAGADHFVVSAGGDDPLQRLARIEVLDELGDPSLGLGARGHRRPAPVAHHRRIGEQREYGIGIVGARAAQAQPVPAQLRERRQCVEDGGNIDAGGVGHRGLAWLC